jgi:hypothetical protein
MTAVYIFNPHPSKLTEGGERAGQSSSSCMALSAKQFPHFRSGFLRQIKTCSGDEIRVEEAQFVLSIAHGCAIKRYHGAPCRFQYGLARGGVPFASWGKAGVKLRIAPREEAKLQRRAHRHIALNIKGRAELFERLMPMRAARDNPETRQPANADRPLFRYDPRDHPAGPCPGRIADENLPSHRGSRRARY